MRANLEALNRSQPAHWPLRGASPRTVCRRPVARVASAEQAEASSLLPPEIKRIVFTEEQVQSKVREIGRRISADYKGKKLLVVGVLNGAFVFTADLVRSIHPYLSGLQIDFIRASSYGAASESGGRVEVDALGCDQRWVGWHVLLVEDIIDSGHTLKRLGEVFSDAGAESVRYVALLDKKGRRRVDCFPDYVGYDCPDEFIVGYGLDFNEQYRYLPYVAALKEEAYRGSGH